MCQTSSVSRLPLSPHWVRQREQDTLYSLSYTGSRNETLISCVCLSADSGVRRMSSKCSPCPTGMLTRAGCTVRDKSWDVDPAPVGEIRDNSFLLDLQHQKLDGCSMRPSAAGGIQFLSSMFNFLCTKVLYFYLYFILSKRSESCDVLYCAANERLWRTQAEEVGAVFRNRRFGYFYSTRSSV